MILTFHLLCFGGYYILTHFSSIVLGFSLAAFGLNLPISIKAAEKVGATTLVAVLFTLALNLQLNHMFAPIYVFFLLYGSITNLLKGWLDDLKARPLHRNSVNVFLMECKQFTHALKMSNDLFTNQLFFISFGILISLVASIFRTVSFFLGGYEWTNINISLMVGYASVGLNMAFIFCMLTFTVQHIEDSVNDLIEKVFDIQDETGGGPALTLDTHLQNQVVRKLQNFDGYSALDFFNLKKSLLSSIFANVVTYLIVLIQFRVSEPVKITKI
jgi:hypothetical protein